MEFFDRDSEIAYMKRILEQYPRRIIFVYGPINSGKTALVTEVLRKVGKRFAPFYFNLRHYDITGYRNFIQLFFKVEKTEHPVEKFVRDHADAISKIAISLLSGALAIGVGVKIPVPESIFKEFFERGPKPEDAFDYMKQFFKGVVDSGVRPILVLDELQRLRSIKTNSYLLDSLFNFFVGLTKETHLAHVVAVTSDCLFIEHVYGVARLEGRVEYIKIDDLDKDRARELYENLELPKGRFEFVWGYLGGKINDYLALEMEYRAGMEIDVALERMLRDEMNRLLYLLMQFSYKEVRYVDEDGSE